MLHQTINAALVDVGDRDLAQRQPVPEVVGYTAMPLTDTAVCPISSRWRVNSATHGARSLGLFAASGPPNARALVRIDQHGRD